MIRSDVSNSRKARTWEHSMCALGDVEENKNDANTSAVGKLAIVSASGLTPEITMKQCEEIMARRKKTAKQRNEAHEQSGSPSSGPRDGCTQTSRSRESRDPEQREACVETVATSGTGAVQDQSGWCLVEESISSVVKELLDDRSACMRDENMLATVTDDQEQEDVSTAAPHGAVSPRWLKVCQKRPKKAATRTEAQEMLDFTAVQNVNEEKITIAMDSGAAVSFSQDVPKNGGPENRFCRVANGSKRQDFGGTRITFKANNGSTQPMNFRLADVASASVTKICQRRHRVVFDEEGGILENKASGRRVPMRVTSLLLPPSST